MENGQSLTGYVGSDRFWRLPFTYSYSVDFLQGDRVQFFALLKKWREERNPFVSSVAEKIACPSHLRIIAMGERALPFIMEQLAEGPLDQWCPALEAITGENPVPETAAGDLVEISKAWLAWDKSRTQTFRFSAQRITALPAPVIRVTTVSPGLQDAPLGSGGLQPDRPLAGIGHRAYQQETPWMFSWRSSRDSGMRSAATEIRKLDTRRLLSSYWTGFRHMLPANYPTVHGRAN